jgi:hypothetical protein
MHSPLATGVVFGPTVCLLPGRKFACRNDNCWPGGLIGLPIPDIQLENRRGVGKGRLLTQSRPS